MIQLYQLTAAQMIWIFAAHDIHSMVANPVGEMVRVAWEERRGGRGKGRKREGRAIVRHRWNIC